MNKDDWVSVINETCIVVGGTLMVMSVVIYVLFLRSHGNICLGNPIPYGVNALSEANGAEMTCTCSLNKFNTPVIYVNRTSIQVGGVGGFLNTENLGDIILNETKT